MHKNIIIPKLIIAAEYFKMRREINEDHDPNNLAEDIISIRELCKYNDIKGYHLTESIYIMSLSLGRLAGGSRDPRWVLQAIEDLK